MTRVSGGVCRLPPLHRMVWDAGDLAGTEITCLGRTGNIAAAVHETGATPENPFPAIGVFIEALDSWNLKFLDGRSVPCTLTAFLDFDSDFIRVVLARWVDAVQSEPYPHRSMLAVELGEQDSPTAAPAAPPPVPGDLDLPESTHQLIDAGLPLTIGRFQRHVMPGDVPGDGEITIDDIEALPEPEPAATG